MNFVTLLTMDIQAEKYHLIQQVVNLQYSSIISKLKELLGAQSTNTDWQYELTTSEKTAIDKGWQDLKNGNTIAHEVVRKQMKQKIEQFKNKAS